MTKRSAALRGMIGHRVEIHRGAVRLASGNLLGPLPELAGKGRRRLWGAAYSDAGKLAVAAFDPLDADIEIALAL